MSRARIQSLSNMSLTAIFIIVVFSPLFISILMPKIEISNTEKRELAPMPEFNLDMNILYEFPVRFEAFYNDHFGFRNTLIRWHNYFKVKWIGKSPNDKVIIGKHGWLYYNYKPDKIIDIMKGEYPFSQSELNAWKTDLEYKHNKMKEKGIRYIFIVVPNKHSVYPEYIPPKYLNKKGKTRLDQLIEYLNLNSDFEILDLRNELIESKATSLVYEYTDTHWNDSGAFVGYKKIWDKINEWFPDDKLIDENMLETFWEVSDGGDLSSLLGLPELLKENRPIIKLKSKCWEKTELDIQSIQVYDKFTTTCSNAKLNGLVFRDSAFVRLVPFFSEHFTEIRYIWHSYNKSVFEEMTSQFHPDVVIEEIVERNLAYSPPQNEEYDNEVQKKKFNALSVELLVINAENGYAGIHSSHDAVTYVKNNTFTVESKSNDPFFLLPNINFPEDLSLILKLSVTSPTFSTVKIYYRTQSIPQYTEKQSLKKSISKGYNETFFKLPGKDITGHLRIDIGNIPGKFLLHSLEVRCNSDAKRLKKSSFQN